MKPDLEQFRPFFARDKESVSLWIVGDAIQDRVRIGQSTFVNNSTQINPAKNLAGTRGNSDDLVCLPNVCIDLSGQIFEFIEVLNRLPC